MHGVEEPVHLIHVRREIGRLDAFERLDLVFVPQRDLFAFGENLIHAPELGDAERGGQFADARVQRQQARDADGVALLRLAVAQVTQRADEIQVVGDDDRAFAATQGGRLREIEDRAVAECTHPLPGIARAYGFGAILDQEQIVPECQCAQGFPVSRMAVAVARQDCCGFFRDFFRRLLRRQRARPVIDVGEHRRGAGQRNAARDLVPGMCRSDDFAARADFLRLQAQPQRQRRTAHRHRVLASQPGGERTLECLDQRPLAQTRRAQCRLHHFQFRPGNVGVGQADQLICHVTPLPPQSRRLPIQDGRSGGCTPRCGRTGKVDTCC